MSAQTELCGNAVTPHTFEVKDDTGKIMKTYPLRLIDDDVHAAWEKEQLKRARDFEKGNRELCASAEEFQQRLDRLSEKYRAGEYTLMHWFVKNAPHFQASAAGAALSPQALAQGKELADGIMLLTALIFQCPVSEARTLMLRYGAEVASLVALIVQESLPVSRAAAAVPAAGMPTGAAVPNC